MPKLMQLAVAFFLAGTAARVLYGQEPASPQPATTAPASQPQKSEPEPKTEVSVQDTGNTFKLRVNLVQVHVTVRDKAGKPVEGLRKEDFQLFDNGKLQPISTFGVETVFTDTVPCDQRHSPNVAARQASSSSEPPV